MWTKLADSLSWSQGHQGKGYLLHDGTIKTWNVDTFNPIDHFTVHQQNGETSPSALNFEIDPDGGVVTDEPTTKVEAITNADSRLYDAGQRPVFEDDFNLQSFEPSPKEKHSPDYNFIMSREHSSGIYHYHPWTGLPCVCPWGESKHRGKTSSSQYVRQIKNQKQKAFRTPEGERFLEALDNLIERFPDAEAMAPWMASRYKKGDMVLSPEGEIHHHMGYGTSSLADQLEQLKQGDLDRASRSGYSVANLAKKLAYDKWDQLPWHERYDSLGRSRMDRSGELRISPKQLSELTMQGYHPILSHMEQYFSPTTHVLTGWSHWFNARQHPTRRGVDIMQHSPGSVQNMAREHAQALEEARKREYWLQDYADPGLGDWEKPDVRHVFGSEAGPYKGWNVVKLNARQAEGDSEALGHCIGSDDQPYKYNIDTGNINAYSLRDAEGYPHVSWHVNPSGHGIGHMQGQGSVPDKYRNLISMFNESHNLPDEEVGEEALEPEEPEYDEYYTLPEAVDMDDYIQQKEDPWAVAHDDPHANIGENTELEYREPNWASIANHYLKGNGMRNVDRFFRFLYEHGETSDFASELEDQFDPDDADERELVQYWNSEGARNSDDWVEIPTRPANEVDQYNERVDEGEEPEVENWNALAYDYLRYPDHYSSGSREYEKFHDNIAQQYNHSPYDMHEALQNVVDWDDPNHSKAMGYWNQHWQQKDPDYVIPQPTNPPYEEDPNMPVEQPVNEPGVGPVQSKWEWQRVSDYQGWTNWETWNTALMADNEYETYTKSRELVQQGATPQQLEQWMLQAVVGPHNQAMIKDAQEWNAIDPDERRRMTDERDREQFGDAAVDLGRGLMEPFGGFSDPGEDDTAEIIDPNEVNWYEIYTHIYQELQGNREWATEKGEEFPELPEQHPDPMDQPGDFTLPEGWTSSLKTSDGYMMDPIAVPGKEEMSPPRNEQEAVFQAIGEAAQNGDYERARWLYQFLPENMNPVNQEPMQSGHEILSPATELQEWLGDLGGEEPEAPSIHHNSPEDTIVAPQTSTSEALPYFPPGNIPKEYKQSATDEEEYYDITDHPDLWCSKCGKSGMQYFKPKRPGTGSVWYCPHCKHSYHTADIPKTDDLAIDKQIYRGMQDQWRPQHEVAGDLRQADELQDLLGIEEPEADERPVPPGLPPNARPMPAEHQNMDLQCADCGDRNLREQGYAQDPATGNFYCLTCVDARQHLGRVSMAERSGFPELDQAIEEFMQSEFKSPATSVTDINEYRSPEGAWGSCEYVAEALAEFLKERGFKAYATSDDLRAFPGYENAQDSAAIGAGEFNYPEHAMVEVYGLYGPNNVNNVTIDFTASQYGFTEFPKIHGGPADHTGSAPKIPQHMFHVSPSVPDDIMTHGLRQDPPAGNQGYGYNAWGVRRSLPGVYMAPEEHMDEWNDPNASTYLIDTSHLDPALFEPDEMAPGAWRYKGDVPPHALEDFGPLGYTAKTAAPINQADATNDPLGKSPAMIPQRDGDPDYLEVAPCPHCQQPHRPDEPCPTNSVTQFRQQERAWYNRDNNAQHGPGPGPNGLEDHVSAFGNPPWRQMLDEMTPEAMAEGRSCYFHPDRPAVIADGFAPMCGACAASWNQVNAEKPKVAGSWDPLTCEQCGAPMTEPKMLGNKYMNHCTRCGLWREVPTNFPILQQQRQEEAISPYPSILREVGPERAWISSTWEW